MKPKYYKTIKPTVHFTLSYREQILSFSWSGCVNPSFLVFLWWLPLPFSLSEYRPSGRGAPPPSCCWSACTRASNLLLKLQQHLYCGSSHQPSPDRSVNQCGLFACYDLSLSVLTTVYQSAFQSSTQPSLSTSTFCFFWNKSSYLPSS